MQEDRNRGILIETNDKRSTEMSVRTIHKCQCEVCQKENESSEKMIHHQINVVMSRLDEQQRRWLALHQCGYQEKRVDWSFL